MDDAKRESYASADRVDIPYRVGGRSGCLEAWGMPWVERPLVQISVVVAIIEVRTFKAEVG